MRDFRWGRFALILIGLFILFAFLRCGSGRYHRGYRDRYGYDDYGHRRYGGYGGYGGYRSGGGFMSGALGFMGGYGLGRMQKNRDRDRDYDRGRDRSSSRSNRRNSFSGGRRSRGGGFRFGK